MLSMVPKLLEISPGPCGSDVRPWVSSNFYFEILPLHSVPYDKHMDLKKCLANLLDQLLLKLPNNHQALKGEVMVLWILSVDVMTSSASKLPSGLNLLASISRSTTCFPPTLPEKRPSQKLSNAFTAGLLKIHKFQLWNRV